MHPRNVSRLVDNRFLPKPILNDPKPFFWNKLSNALLGSTVWIELGSPEGLVLNMKELEDTFTVDNSTQSGASPVASASSLIRKQAVTTLLDITRANNVGECSSNCTSYSNNCATAIMLTRMKLHHSDIKKALLAVDDDRLSTDDLKAISKQLPNQDETSRIRDFGDISRLAKADQYFAEVRWLALVLSHLLTVCRSWSYRGSLSVSIVCCIDGGSSLR